jgi:hypothetical protein
MDVSSPSGIVQSVAYWKPNRRLVSASGGSSGAAFTIGVPALA